MIGPHSHVSKVPLLLLRKKTCFLGQERRSEAVCLYVRSSGLLVEEFDLLVLAAHSLWTETAWQGTEDNGQLKPACSCT